MTPRLLLLTGPAAGDVAAVLRSGILASELRSDPVRGTVNVPVPWWDEVRDYLDAPRSISDQFCGCKTVTPEGVRASIWRAECMGRAIRSLPGGEAWLVGLVLPAHCFCCFGGGQEYCAYRNAEPLAKHWRCEYCRRKGDLPARLAILAPDPPPLMVERIDAWGGEHWECMPGEYTGMRCQILHRTPVLRPGQSRWANADTWPEAVRAAMGAA